MTDWSKYSPQKKFLAPEILERAAVQMFEQAERQGVAAVLAGGVALQYFGSPRLTGDVDFVASAPLHAKQEGQLTFGGQKLRSPEDVPVDWIVRDDDFTELYEAAVDDPLPSNNSPAPIPIARPEYLLAMKLATDRTTDAADVEWLIASGSVDLKKTRQIIKRYLGAYAAQDFDAVVSEVEWKKSRGTL